MIVDERYNADLQVTLYLDKTSDAELLTVAVSDAGDSWVLVPKNRAEAIEMFNHPLAYKKVLVDV